MTLSRKKKWLIGCGGLVSLLVVVLALLIGRAWEIALGPEGHYFDSAGIRIHYSDEGQGVPVVLIHGFANPANLQWRRPGLIEALSKEYRVIALDVRGHGRSGKPHDPSQYGVQMVEDLVRLLDHLQIEKAHLVGYSMGGFITLKMAVLHADRVLSAAACGAGWEKASQENRDFAEAVAQAVENGESGPLLKRLGIVDRPLSFLERLASRISLTYFNDPLALAAVARGANALALSEEELRSNTVPTLTIIGSKDGLLPDAQALTACMAHHELVVVEGKNHMNTDVSAEFLQTLRAFLARHTPSHDEVFAPAMLEPVEPQHLRMGGFWKEQVKRLTEKWLPHCVAQMEVGGSPDHRTTVHAARYSHVSKS